MYQVFYFALLFHLHIFKIPASIFYIAQLPIIQRFEIKISANILQNLKLQI